MARDLVLPSGTCMCRLKESKLYDIMLLLVIETDYIERGTHRPLVPRPTQENKKASQLIVGGIYEVQ